MADKQVWHIFCFDGQVYLYKNQQTPEVKVENLNVIIDHINSLFPDHLEEKSPYGLRIGGKGNVHCLVTSTFLEMQTIEKAIGYHADVLLINYTSLYNHEMDGIIRDCYKCVKTLLNYEIDLLIYPAPFIAETEERDSLNLLGSYEDTVVVKMLGRHLEERFGLKHYHVEPEYHNELLVNEINQPHQALSFKQKPEASL